MIVVRFHGSVHGWYWGCIGANGGGAGYMSADHALRDAWTWCGRDVPALIYTRRRS